MTSDIFLALTLPAVFVYTIMHEYAGWKALKSGEMAYRLANRLARAQRGLRV